MKKNSFVEGTLIATIAIILVKFLGMLYVIPFYKIIGEGGGALYSYAYNVYNLFLNISIAGIPVALSKLISEYNALEMYDAKERSYKVARNIILLIALVTFFIMFVFSKEVALLILGKIEGGNSLEDVSFVIKCVSFCLLIIPFLSTLKGYLQGHKIIAPTSTSQILEQLVRIIIILMGSYIVINILGKSISLGVGVAVLGAFFGGVAAYLYLKYKVHKNKELLKVTITKKDDVTNNEILKKIIRYSVPLIIISIAADVYTITDMSLIIRTLSYLGYAAKDAETISSMFATWAPKICMIVTAVAMGMTMSLIPHLSSSFAKQDYKDANNTFNKAISIIFISALPLTIGIAFLSTSVYSIFYGDTIYGGVALAWSSAVAFFACLSMIFNAALESLSKFKAVYIASFVGFGINALLDVPLMLLCNYLGFDAYIGAPMASIIGYLVSYVVCLKALTKGLHFSYKDSFINILLTLLSSAAMLIALYILKIFIPTYYPSRGINILICFLYALVGASVYILVSVRSGLIKRVFGSGYFKKVFNKFRRKNA